MSKKYLFQNLLCSICAFSLFQTNSAEADQGSMSLCSQPVAFPAGNMEKLISNAYDGLKTIKGDTQNWNSSTTKNIRKTLNDTIVPLANYIKKNNEDVLNLLEKAGFNIDSPTADSPVTGAKGLHTAVNAFSRKLRSAKNSNDIVGELSIMSNDIAALHGNGVNFPYVCPACPSSPTGAKQWEPSSN